MSQVLVLERKGSRRLRMPLVAQDWLASPSVMDWKVDGFLRVVSKGDHSFFYRFLNLRGNTRERCILNGLGNHWKKFLNLLQQFVTEKGGKRMRRKSTMYNSVRLISPSQQVAANRRRSFRICGRGLLSTERSP